MPRTRIATIRQYIKYRRGGLNPIYWERGYCDNECSWETELCFSMFNVRELLLEHAAEWHFDEVFIIEEE